MKLRELLKTIRPITVTGDDDVEIKGVNIDSRRVRQGDLFVAIPGTRVDGHSFIGSAIEQGAAAILSEHIPTEPLSRRATFVIVESTEKAVGYVVNAFYGDPSRHLTLVGVTGTNGKTTVATLLYNMFRSFGMKCGLISTVCNYIDEERLEADHTTPDPVELAQLLARMVASGCRYAFMESSSHAIAQHRIGGLKFAGGIFTNLTRDHLDYHKTFENYLNAKKAFFDSLPKGSFAITNADDKNGMVMVQNTKARVKTYSVRGMADYRARIIEEHFEGMYLDIDGKEVGVHFIGRFNVSNLLAVYAAARELGRDPEEILVSMSAMHSVSGRLEPIRSPKGFIAVVDYAHTPDALVNVLTTLCEVLSKGGHLITVCGAGGNRDKGKRPLMAREAAQRSDRVIITSDNPRYEQPEDICRDMVAGLNDRQRKKVITVVDRKEAIRAACLMAEKGDIVLVAGKGHEDYQEIKGVKHHFDDREVLRELFKE